MVKSGYNFAQVKVAGELKWPNSSYCMLRMFVSHPTFAD